MIRLLLILLLGLLPFSAAAQLMPKAAVDAVRLAGDEDWFAARGVAVGQAQDAVTVDLVEWLRLRAGEGTFADYRAFGTKRPDWPGLRSIRAKGEEAIPENADPGVVLQWFGDVRPQTGLGAVRLAQALDARGLIGLADDVVATAWIELRLSEEGHDALLEAFPDRLAPHHAARVDALLWRWRTEEAERMLPLLSEDQAKLAAARLGYIQNKSDLAERVEAVPVALKSTPALKYDRCNWLVDRGRRAEAVAVALGQSTSAEALGQPFRWSGWRRSLARWEMREGRPTQAYRLATQHFLEDGNAFADLEWLAGYIALTYLNEPAAAIGHFEKARAEIDTPISIARMEYWIGRAFEALGDARATAAYQRAAEHQTAFYGLIASEKLARPLNAALTGQNDPRDWENSDILENEKIRAALTLLEAGERGAAVTFFADLGRTLDAETLSLLGAALEAKGESFFELILGKSAMSKGRLVPSSHFPIHPLSEMDLPTNPALALSIARRESEFNPVVGSPVGALGLMQLMPATAEEVAGFLDLPYSRGRLTADWRYNARLGSKYLAVLEEEFGYSPVQIAAGYNAGPSRPAIWMSERGDPRLGEVDVIDWIEHIPFRETRNYVMRITESIPIYEARLSGEVGPVQFMELLTGIKPNIRPEMRPDDLSSPEGLTTSLRPTARP